MRSFFLLLTALFAATGLAFSAARAADVVPEPEFSWTAFHIGAGGGGGWNLYDAESRFCHDDQEEDEIDNFVCDGSGDLSDADFLSELSGNDLGAFYGLLTVEAGFDYDFGGFVLGILGNYDFNGDSSADVEYNREEDDDDFENSKLEAELDDTWFLGARAGFTVGGITGGPNTSLIYVLGGYTWADGSVESSVDFRCCNDGHSGDLNVDEDGSVDGWTIGGGIETMIWDAASLKVEYRHDFLDDIEWDECGANDDCNERTAGEVDFSRDTVRAVLSWRFGSWW
jgi:outer membrane immunogenic protein